MRAGNAAAGVAPGAAGLWSTTPKCSCSGQRACWTARASVKGSTGSQKEATLTNMLIARVSRSGRYQGRDATAGVGHSTLAMATSISNTAVQSCQCSTSPRISAPLNTPSTGIIITLRVDATGGRLRAR